MITAIDFVVEKVKRVKKSEKTALNPDCTILLKSDISETMSIKLSELIENLLLSDPVFKKEHE
jgi:hypothetical protein